MPTGSEAAPLRLAIVGCGVIGALHTEVAAADPDLHVVALVDPMVERAQALRTTLSDAGQHEPTLHSDLAAALGAGGIDAVVVCTPSGDHVAPAAAALAAGAHVVTEKPLDASLPAARDFWHLAKDHPDQIVAVISQHRHDPSAQAVQQALSAGRLGRVTSAVVNVDWFRTQEYYDSASWRGTWAGDGGGVLINQGIHSIDLLLWFLGEPVDVVAHTARLAHDHIEGEDVAVAIVRFASGALATVHASTCVYPDLGVRIQVHGTDGAAVIEGDDLTFLHVRDAEGETWVANHADQVLGEQEANQTVRGSFDPHGSHASQYGDSHALQWADIIDAIRTGRSPSVGVDDGLLALATVRAMYVSATLGRPISVDDVRAGRYDDVRPQTGQVPPASPR